MTDAELSCNRKQVNLALKCWYLTGATAGGKTSVSLILAEKLGAEIVSMDSMAIYRDMDIGTAKPNRDQRNRVVHHLIDIVSPNESFSVSKYRDSALQKIDESRERGKNVLFVGGSSLYLKALVRGLFDGPPADWKYRELLEEEADEMGDEALMQRLKVFDPVTAHKLHVNDRRRIVRALEVLHLTGKPISHWQMEFDYAHRAEECRVFAIRHPRPILHDRIANRVNWMYESGLVDEVKTILDRYQSLSQTAAQAVGYCEVIEHLDGKRTLAEAREQTLIRTRRFARHQETWFRGLSEVEFVDIVGQETAEQTADRILQTGMGRNSAGLFDNVKT
ncbi:MAG: tRNA (adenosine(37)-N6)-dimethylallyltransferase MiaA [Pirellulaceae bacterium]